MICKITYLHIGFRLKKSKEGERIRLEEDSQRNVEPIDPLTGRTADECEQEESTELELSMLSLGEHERLARKQQDVKRLDFFRTGLD